MQHRADPIRLRRDFPILSSRVHGKPLIYLDNAATTQKPRSVIDTISNYYKRSNANVHRAAHALSADATLAFEQVRQELADWIGATSQNEIVWTRGTTEAINLVAYSFLKPRLKPGSRILLLETAHHANIVPWQQVAREAGAVIDVMPCAQGEIDLSRFGELLSRGPAIAAISHVSNALGSIYPIKAMCRMAREAQVPVLIDGAQGLPHTDIDVADLGCDFYAFSGHKLFGPTGIGALWAREEILEQMPPWQSGGEMIEQVSFEETRFAGLPFRFEAGTPNIAGVIGLGAAIRYLRETDRAAMEQHEQNLLRHALECCQQVPGFRSLAAGPDQAALFSFLIDGQHPQDVALWLDRQGIAVRAGHHCAMPLMSALGIPGSIRASFAFYNTLDEAEALASALQQLVDQSRSQVHGASVANQCQGVDETLLQELHAAPDWNSRYSILMQIGSDLPPLPGSWKTDEYRLHGCETRVWMVTKVDEEGRMACLADADARILRALLGLLLQNINGLTPQEVLELDLPERIRELDLERNLSPSRGNGLNAMIDALLSFARLQHTNPTNPQP
ncbi:SufS family cysteine desulfurase [Marinobacterium lutimaris]|uniref:cysteine desulfurase n=1 Tax=Marinobacterium lutimaris TaxID=568106 RepID=A0A1H5WU80_9GAMM|nr:SufS family cysteine desulfurase [Marinobacterium lutimaris]SEG03001.1 cysteine desulfurase [Marinobacterium lutimaris]